MANQIITVDTNHDALTGRLAGEDIAMQLGAVLTIDSMPHLTVSGILGQLTITRGTLHIDGNEDFLAVNASIANDVYIAYLDALAAAAIMAFQVTYLADRNLMVVVRDGGVTPIKQFVASWNITNTSKSLSVIRTTDA